jgi:hypothetical protein
MFRLIFRNISPLFCALLVRVYTLLICLFVLVILITIVFVKIKMSHKNIKTKYFHLLDLSRSSTRTLQVNRIEEMGDTYLLTRCCKPSKLK